MVDATINVCLIYPPAHEIQSKGTPMSSTVVWLLWLIEVLIGGAVAILLLVFVVWLLFSVVWLLGNKLPSQIQFKVVNRLFLGGSRSSLVVFHPGKESQR